MDPAVSGVRSRLLEREHVKVVHPSVKDSLVSAMGRSKPVVLLSLVMCAMFLLALLVTIVVFMLNVNPITLTAGRTYIYATFHDVNDIVVLDSSGVTVSSGLLGGGRRATGLRSMLVMPDGSLLFSQSLTSYSVIFRLPNRCSGVVLTKLVTQNLLHPYQLAHNGRGTLYVTNQNSNAVTRYNLTTGNPVGPNALFVTVTNPRGVAINAAGTRVYVAARDDGLLIEYDEASGVQLRSWPVPAPIYVLVANGLVVVDSASDNTVRVIDPVSGTEIRRLSVSGLLHGAGMTITSNNTLLVWSQDTSQIYAWDFATFSSLGLWKGGFSILPQGLTEVE